MRTLGIWGILALCAAVFLPSAAQAATLTVTGRYTPSTDSGTTVDSGTVYVWGVVGNTGSPYYNDIYDWDPRGPLNGYDTVTINASGAITGNSNAMSNTTAENQLTMEGGTIVGQLTMNGLTDNHLDMHVAGSSITGSVTMNGRGDMDITAGIVSGTLATTTAGSLIYIHGTANLTGTINMSGGSSTLRIGGNTTISNTSNVNYTGNAYTFIFEDQSTFSADWDIAGNNHNFNIAETTNFNGNANFLGGGNTVNVSLGRDYDTNAPTPAIDMTGQIVFNTTTPPVDPAASNTVNINSGTLTNENGSVIASNILNTSVNVAGGTTTLLVSGDGNRDLDDDATTYTVTGGHVHNIRQQDANNPTLSGGDWITGYVTKNDLTDTAHTATFGGGTQTGEVLMQSYSLLNLDTLTTTPTAANTKVVLHVGGFTEDWLVDTISNQDNTHGQGTYGNQITTDKLNVGANSKLILHADADHMTLDNATVMTNYLDERSIANVTNVAGELTLDRASLHSTTPDTLNTQVNVLDGGIIYGFGENAYDPKDPANAADIYTANFHEQYEQLRAQIYGNMNLATGATLQPYDLGLSSYYYQGGLKLSSVGLFDGWDYDTYGIEHRGSVFRVDTETLAGDGGTTTFNRESGMRGRLFGDWDNLGGFDGREAIIHGERNDAPGGVTNMQYSDSLLTVNADFSDVFAQSTNTANTALQQQTAKVKYDPVFGFQYDLLSKQQFDIYRDEGLQDTTYYYAVVNSENIINELNQPGYNDANHLFDKLILKSDMLGKYDFLKSEDNQSIYLRYRMLAYHPTEGGIKRTMTEDGHYNEIVPGQYLDEIRYPFIGQPGSDLNGLLNGNTNPSDLAFGDPSSNATYGDPLAPPNSYNDAGYNGDMQDFYRHATTPGDRLYNPLFDNYRDYWVDDWANLFQGMQLAVPDNRNLHHAVRMLHAETYANVSQTAFDVMNLFTRNRERNAVSALFQVENEFYEEAMETAGMASDSAYASMDDYNPDDFYVENPLRFWGSAFGAYGRQMESDGSSGGEMGYSNTTWGGSVGVIKEIGDYYVGGTIGYANTKTRYDYSDITANHYIAEALVGARIFCLGFAELFASYSYGDTKNARVVDLASQQLGGYYGVATGDFASHVFNLGTRFGYQKVFGNHWLFLPTVGVNVLHHTNGEFVESGRVDMANRMVFDRGGMKRTTLRIPIEARLNRAIAIGDWMLMPEVRAGITPVLLDKRGKATAKWVGHVTNNRYFTSLGADRGSFEGWVGATIELSKKGRFYAAANYDYTYAKNHGSHNYSIQAGLNF